MKKAMKRMLTIALALILLCMAVPAAFADHELTPETGTQTVYLDSKTGAYYAWITLASGDYDFTIKRSSVKVTPGDTGAKLIALDKSCDISTYDEDYYQEELEEWETYQAEYCYYHYEICLKLTHSGTAKVTYKIGSKTYKITIKVKAYVNPVSSITITGVNSGKSFASKCKKELPYAPTLSFPSVVSSATLKIKPKTGWKIRYYDFEDMTTGKSRSMTDDSGMSSVSRKVGKLDPSHEYYVNIEFINTSTGASLDWSFRFGSVSD